MRTRDFIVFTIDNERNAQNWWDAGGIVLWKEAQTRAGNINTWRQTNTLAVAATDPFDIIKRFQIIPGWDEEKPLKYTRIIAPADSIGSLANAIDHMKVLGVTEENLRALDLIEETEGE